jgi:hypothetical protein
MNSLSDCDIFCQGLHSRWKTPVGGVAGYRTPEKQTKPEAMLYMLHPLLPHASQVLNHPYPRTHHPWEQKVEKAFGRAGHNFDKHTFPNGMGTRAWLAHATKDHQDM